VIFITCNFHQTLKYDLGDHIKEDEVKWIYGTRGRDKNMNKNSSGHLKGRLVVRRKIKL